MASAPPSGSSRTSRSNRSLAALERPAARAGCRSTTRCMSNMPIVAASTCARSMIASSGLLAGVSSVRLVAPIVTAKAAMARSIEKPSSP